MSAEETSPIFQVINMVMPERCYDEFFVKHNFFHEQCLKMTISKLLGYTIILGSVMVKLPQIIKIIRARSVIGLSLAAFYLELIAVTVTMAYSIVKKFAFSAWGEAFFLAVQCCILVALYYIFVKQYALALLFLPVYGAALYILCSGMTPANILTNLQGSSIFLVVLAKLLQVVENFRNGHTGQLSAITTFLLLGGSIARILTTIQETGDALMLVNYLAATALNAVLWSQILYYWNVIPKGDKSKSD